MNAIDRNRWRDEGEGDTTGTTVRERVSCVVWEAVGAIMLVFWIVVILVMVS